MANLKTYSISTDITAGAVQEFKLHQEINDGGFITGFDGLMVNGDNLTVMGTSFADETGCDTAVQDHVVGPENPDVEQKQIDSWSFNGIFATSSSSFGAIPEQIIVPIMEQLMAGATKIEAKLSVSTENTSTSIGEADVFNYTDSAEIIGSVVSLPNGGWSHKISDAWFDVTGEQGKAIRPRVRRESGSGLTRIESAQLIFKITKT